MVIDFLNSDLSITFCGLSITFFDIFTCFLSKKSVILLAFSEIFSYLCKVT